MGCQANFLYRPVLCDFASGKRSIRGKVRSPESIQASLSVASLPKEVSTVSFRSTEACKLGIARYPDFEYNAKGGGGTGSVVKVDEDGLNDKILVSFDAETLYIPPLSSQTTKFLRLPLPPLLKIDIVPTLLKGTIAIDSGKVDLEFEAKFLFSVGSIYKAPPLLVKTVLTSEESSGTMRGGRGIRVKEDGSCSLVGVAVVEPIDDFFMNSFLGLPTECFARLNALFVFPNSS